MVSEVNKYILSVLGILGFWYLVRIVAQIGDVGPFVAIFLLLTGIILAIGYISIQFYKGFQESPS